ncbi:MAG: maleate cis-trans isomerase [Acidobacteria bacterium]|nr:MAG: maleate cis-trans isomerase [Acidobacteriota bacterium]
MSESPVPCPQCDASGLTAMNNHIDLAARQLATWNPDLIVYMCTSGSFMEGISGERAIRDRLVQLTSLPTITTSRAVLAALKQLQLKRVVMLTPYDEDLTRREIAWLKENDVEVTDFRFRNIPDNLSRGAQSPEESFRIVSRLKWCEADGVFLSCANVRNLEIIETLEIHTGKPVVTSTVATTWLALRTTGVNDPIKGYGRLLFE